MKANNNFSKNFCSSDIDSDLNGSSLKTLARLNSIHKDDANNDFIEPATSEVTIDNDKDMDEI